MPVDSISCIDLPYIGPKIITSNIFYFLFRFSLCIFPCNKLFLITQQI